MSLPYFLERQGIMTEREWRTFFKLLYKIVHLPVSDVKAIRSIIDANAVTSINQSTLREFLSLYR